MKPSKDESKSRTPRVMREAVSGYAMFPSKDPDKWKYYLEELGKLCAEAWRDDLPEADREWAEAHREKFGRWVNDSRPNGIDASVSTGSLQSGRGTIDGESALPWPMLLEALKSAFLAVVEALKNEPAEEKVRAPFDTATRVDQTYLWQTLNADATAEEHRPSVLRAFRRGFRIARRGRPGSRMRTIPPMLDPPYFWGAMLPPLTGPSAERDRALRASWLQSKDPKESTAHRQALRELYASVWREDVLEEDREWAQTYYDVCSNWVNRRRRDAVGRGAYEGYLQSSDGLFNGEPAKPWGSFSGYISESWCSFADRVEDAPEGESELATAEAAAREYWDTLYQEAPPWDSDPAQVHWLAAVRATRKAAAALDTSAPTEK